MNLSAAIYDSLDFIDTHSRSSRYGLHAFTRYAGYIKKKPRNRANQRRMERLSADFVAKAAQLERIWIECLGFFFNKINYQFSILIIDF